MAKGPERLTGFIATVKKPDKTEAASIILAQSLRPNTQIICYFDTDGPNPRITTRIPSLHRRHGIKKGMIELFKDMQDAELIQIVDISKL